MKKHGSEGEKANSTIRPMLLDRIKLNAIKIISSSSPYKKMRGEENE